LIWAEKKALRKVKLPQREQKRKNKIINAIKKAL